MSDTTLDMRTNGPGGVNLYGFEVVDAICYSNGHICVRFKQANVLRLSPPQAVALAQQLLRAVERSMAMTEKECR